MPKGVYTRKKHAKKEKAEKKPEKKPEQYEPVLAIEPRPEDMQLIRDMVKRRDRSNYTPREALAEIVIGYRDSFEQRGEEKLIMDRLRAFGKKMGWADNPRYVLGKLVEQCEIEHEHPEPMQHELETIKAFIAKHNLTSTPMEVIQYLIDQYEDSRPAPHTTNEKVFDYNMREIEAIMKEYNSTFNETLSLLISSFKGEHKI